MPRQKDFKRTIRARMQKTGESYTTARRQLLAKRSPDAAEFARLAGMHDEAVRAKTGKTWRQWVSALDAVGATGMPHREIARHVGSEYGVSGWWAQTVTVGYERIRGLREIGQRRGGDFDANKSKTFPVPVERLYKAFAEKRRRVRWLEGAEPVVRTSQANRSVRMSWPDGTKVNAWFESKAAQKSRVAIQHGGLKSKAEVARRKEEWTARLAILARILSLD